MAFVEEFLVANDYARHLVAYEAAPAAVEAAKERVRDKLRLRQSARIALWRRAPRKPLPTRGSTMLFTFRRPFTISITSMKCSCP